MVLDTESVVLYTSGILHNRESHHANPHTRGRVRAQGVAPARAAAQNRTQQERDAIQTALSNTSALAARNAARGIA